MSLNLGDLLANAARMHSGETALIDGGEDRDGPERHTFGSLDDRVRRLAAALCRSGLQPGDRVVLMLPNVPEFTLAYFGVLYAGGIAVTVSTLQVAEEVAFQILDCGARVLVVHRDLVAVGAEAFAGAPCCRMMLVAGGGEMPDGAQELEGLLGTERADVALTGPDDTAVILYTSGTTAQPKGAELTHFNLYYNAQLVCERLFSLWPERPRLMQPGDVGLAALPLYHTFGQTNVQNGMLFGGAAVSYLRRFTPLGAMQAIARDQVTFFPGVPTMYFAILHDSEAVRIEIPSLQFCISGGAPMPVEVKRRFQERFGVGIQEGYGLTETSPLAAVQWRDETDRCGTVGKAVAGVQIRIVDDGDQEVPAGERGEVLIRGHNIMKGYYGRPGATAGALRGGWFHSGDIGYLDPRGDLFIVDRKKDLILRGGFNVYPREIEELLYAHPAVREAAVVGVPDDRLGEEVKAVVSLVEGLQVTAEALIAHCRERLAAHKYPRIVEIIDELPKGPTGKILKKALRG